jgi:hypothetical protein
MHFPINDLSDKTPELIEVRGSKTNYWFYTNDTKFLFKLARPNTGEHWAEKTACELCVLLGLPHAHYELAVWRNQKGVLTETVVPPGGRLVMGNELLADVHSDYPLNERYKVQDHTFGRIFTLLSNKDYLLPMSWQPPSDAIQNAVDVFLGYLLLDAWIANQERHHENWGVIHYGEIYLAPTYDHAASMGQNERDAKRHEMLTTRDTGRQISRYIERAHSAIYLNQLEVKPLSTLDIFQHFAAKRPQAAQLWLQRLGDISSEQCQNIFNSIPPTEITTTAAEFAMKLLELNRNRLLEVKP